MSNEEGKRSRESINTNSEARTEEREARSDNRPEVKVDSRLSEKIERSRPQLAVETQAIMGDQRYVPMNMLPRRPPHEMMHFQQIVSPQQSYPLHPGQTEQYTHLPPAQFQSQPRQWPNTLPPPPVMMIQPPHFALPAHLPPNHHHHAPLIHTNPSAMRPQFVTSQPADDHMSINQNHAAVAAAALLNLSGNSSSTSLNLQEQMRVQQQQQQQQQMLLEQRQRQQHLENKAALSFQWNNAPERARSSSSSDRGSDTIKTTTDTKSSDKKSSTTWPSALPHPPVSVPQYRYPFIEKLQSLLRDPASEGIIEWKEKELYIHNKEALTHRILPKYFNAGESTRFNSFLRQLNNYGFENTLHGRIDQPVYRNIDSSITTIEDFTSIKRLTGKSSGAKS